MKKIISDDPAVQKLAGLFAAAMMVSMFVMPAAAEVIDPYKHVWLEMTNGAWFANLSSGSANQSYYFKFDGGGLNELHITNSTSMPYGQVNDRGTTESDTGTFYITNTGGRGFSDDVILMVAVQDGVPDDFSLHINASGYRWPPTPVVNQIPDEDDLVYVPGSVHGDFDEDNFTLYGAQNWKPCSVQGYQLFEDLGNRPDCWLGFIDLKVGVLGLNATTGYSGNLTDLGDVRIDYEIDGIDSTSVSFHAYAWCNQSNQQKGVSWTNALSGATPSGWEFNS